MTRGTTHPASVWVLRRKGARGTTYAIRWIDPRTGRTRTESCGRDSAVARCRRDEKRAELRDQLAGEDKRKTLADLLAAVDAWYAGRAEATRRKTRDSVRLLIELCGDRLVRHVDRDCIMQFRARRLAQGVAVPTVNKNLREIKAALGYAVDAGWIRGNPLWRWRGMQLRESERTVRVVEPVEFEHLAKCIDYGPLRALLHVAYYQGLRRTELCNLRWAAVDLERGLLHVRNVAAEGELTKSRRNRTLPLRKAVTAELTALWGMLDRVVEGGVERPKHPHVFTWPDGRPFRPDWLTHWFSKKVTDAGLPKATLHDLRRSFSTLAQRAGVDRHTVRDLGGWSTVGVVEAHYSGEVPGRLAAATALLDRETAGEDVPSCARDEKSAKAEAS